MTAAVAALHRRTLRSLRERNYRLFFTGQVASLAGSWMQNVALAWLAIELSDGAPLAVAAIAFFRFAPFTILGLVAGAITDRVDAWKLVVGTQTAAMAVSAALATVVLGGLATLPAVYVLAALGGLTAVFDAPGRQALTYRMVGPSALPNAVALNSGLLNGARVVGPALAGVTIATVGVGVCFAVNAASFLAVLAALLVMRRDELLPVRQRHGASLVGDVRAGVAYALRTPDLRAVLGLVLATSLLGFNFNVLVPLLAASLQTGPRTFGILSALFGAGALAGALVAATLGRASWKLLVGGALGFSVGLTAIAAVHGPWLAGALLFTVGGFFTLFSANASSLVQLNAPEHLRGRLIGLYLFSFVGLAPLGSLLTGWLVSAGGTGVAFSVAGAAGIVAAALTRRAAPARTEDALATASDIG